MYEESPMEKQIGGFSSAFKIGSLPIQFVHNTEISSDSKSSNKEMQTIISKCLRPIRCKS